MTRKTLALEWFVPSCAQAERQKQNSQFLRLEVRVITTLDPGLIYDVTEEERKDYLHDGFSTMDGICGKNED